MIRINHPLFTSRIKCSTLSKAVEMLHEKCIAIINPVIICIISDSPRRDPKFHQLLIELGVGRLINEDKTVLEIGPCFRIFNKVFDRAK